MSAFVAEEEKSTNLFLVIDREGIFGEELCGQLGASGTVVFVSKKQSKNPSVIHVPFRMTMPQIPQGRYSHVLFILDGKTETKEVLSPILKKAKQDSANCVVVLPRVLYSQELKTQIHEENNQANICLLGDIFGSSQISSEITEVFDQIKKTGSIQLSDMGLGIVYPVSFSAAVQAILQAGFGTEKQKIFFSFPKHPTTMLSVVYGLQKVDPFIKIDFQNKEKIKKDQELPDGESLIPSAYHPMQELQGEFKKHTQEEASSAKEPGKSVFSLLKITPQRPRFSGKFLFLFAIVLAILLPYIAVLLFWGAGLLLLESAKKEAELGAFTQSKQSAQAAGVFFSLAQNVSGSAISELSIIRQNSLSYALSANIQNGIAISQAAQNLSDAAIRIEKIQKNTSFTTVADASYVVNDIKQASLAMEQAQTGRGIFFNKELTMFQHAFSVAANVADSLPTLLGVQKKQTYAILFQNNTELRPGGGFIGSYATITVDKGNFSNPVIHDVYDADGQLHGHIEPPYILRRYIPVQHWFLRDSNFDVDFPKDAQNAAFFLQAETGENVDGVIALDLSFVREIIRDLRSVYVPEYRQTVTANNFFSLTESHAEKNFFPGSTQKKDFLRALFDSLKTKTQGNKGEMSSLIPTVISALEQKHILMSFADAAVQNVFTANNLSSSLWDPREAQQAVRNGYLGINEANIGVNKANVFLKREVTQKVTVADNGEVSGTLNIAYTNTSDNTWPGGDYKNYLRVILPKGAQITAIAINDQKKDIVSAITDPAVFESKNFIPPLGIEVDKTEEAEKSIFGFVFTAPAGGKTIVQIAYALPETIDISALTFGYNQLLLKQPGTDAYPYAYTITYPKTYKVLTPLQQETIGDNSITRTFVFNTDTQITYSFGKK